MDKRNELKRKKTISFCLDNDKGKMFFFEILKIMAFFGKHFQIKKNSKFSNWIFFSLKNQKNLKRFFRKFLYLRNFYFIILSANCYVVLKTP